MNKTLRRLVASLLCAAMLFTMLPTMVSVSAADTTAPMLAYVPLDNRPVVYQRVELAAGAAGFDIRVPDEDLFRTKLDGQGGTGVNGSQHGDGAAIMNWLDTMEAQGCDYYIIHLDQMLSGGLVGSRHPDSQTVTQTEADIINRLLALANKPENKVYFIDIVMRLASTGSYKGYELAQYNALREWGAKDRVEMDAAQFKTQDYNTSVSLINSIASNYRKAPNGSTIAYNISALTEANVNEYLAFRKRKLTLMNMMIQELQPGATYLVGVDDSSPNKNIQWNELQFLDKRAEAMQLDYVRMSDTDSIGLMAVARCVNDLYGVHPKLQVRYFGNGADKTDDYGNDTLRQNVDSHIRCLNAQSVDSDGELEVLVLTQPDSSYADESYKTAINELVSKAKANIADNIPTIIIEVSEVYIDAWGNGSTNLQDELLAKVEIGKLMGYSNWNTVGNAIGIALGNGVSRYTYLKYEENIAAESHDWNLKSLTYAFIKDISYNARNKLNVWHSYAKNSFHYWLDQTIWWYDANFYLNKTGGTNNMDNHDGATDGNVTAGRAYINEKLEKFMRGQVTDFNGDANDILALMKNSEMYTNLNRAVQTVEIDNVAVSNFRFPWDRHFEIYFDVTGTLGETVTYYVRNSSLISQIPVTQSFTQFSKNAKAQYGATSLTVKDLNGVVISGSTVVGTDFTVTMTINGLTLTYQAVVSGDTDGDAKVNTSDVRQTMNKVLGLETFSDAQTAAADLDGNGRVASTDARRILQITLS